VAAARELAAEGDRGKGVTGVAEGGEQDAPAGGAPVPAQSISASSRTMRLRSSGSKATGETVSVPTPASR
jgi:hypothetical protein